MRGFVADLPGNAFSPGCCWNRAGNTGFLLAEGPVAAASRPGSHSSRWNGLFFWYKFSMRSSGISLMNLDTGFIFVLAVKGPHLGIGHE